MSRNVRWLSAAMLCLAAYACEGGPIIIDHRHTDITRLTSNEIQRAKDKLHIAYGHTSHGSQLTEGMSGLVGFANGGGKGLSFPANFFAWNNGGTGGALDLEEGAGYGSGWLELDGGYWPTWYNETREYLDDPSHADVNVIIWSWCGQMDDKYSGGTLSNEYLLPMAALETSYPDVVFVYMTGHTPDAGSMSASLDNNTKAACQAIKDFCIANNKVLYDFNDIEHYNPDGTCFKFTTDNCDFYATNSGSRLGNWATNWQGTHTQGVDWYNCSAAHSQALNGNQKAYAAWALWCAIANDLDREGIADEWEERYGGADKFGGGTNNFDGDAMTDWEEYVADTVPTNAASSFEILGVDVIHSCTLTFLSSASRVYSLNASDNLCGGAWSVVGELTNQPGTGGMMSLTDTNSVAARAYRLGVSMAP